VYTKDIAFLLRLLGSSKQSGVLLVEAPGPDTSPWLGQFQLDKGRVLSCLVIDKTSGRVGLRDEEALQWLATRGKLEWRLQEEETLPPAPTPRLLPTGEDTQREETHAAKPPLAPPKNLLGAIPQRAMAETVASTSLLTSREHRQVYALVDGQRTIEEIAYLLHRPAEFIISILQELQARGLIV
jgi:hypothetical protein